MEELAFASMLKSWRRKRQLSDLELAEEVEISPRHLSFMESGRSRPSRDIVLNLASALSMPLRDRNAMLEAAGFEPAYRETDLDSDEMETVRRTLTTILERAEPNPTLVLDRLWNVRMANASARHILELFVAEPEAMGEVPNILHMTLHPGGIRQHIRNFEEVATRILRRLRLDARASRAGSELRQLLAKVESFGEMPAAREAAERAESASPFIPLELVKEGLELSLFTTITTLGTAKDITLHDLRIETYYPNDEATEAYLNGLVAE